MLRVLLLARKLKIVVLDHFLRKYSNVGGSGFARVGVPTTHKIQLDDVMQIRYFLADGANSFPSFLALRVMKTEENGLSVFSDVYKPCSSDIETKYVVMEFRSTKDLRVQLTTLRSTPAWATFITAASELAETNKELAYFQQIS